MSERLPPLLLSLLLLGGTGCGSPCAEVEPLSPEPHRLSLSWEAGAASDAQVTYRLHGATHTLQATQASDGTFSAILADLPPLTEIPYTLWQGDAPICTDTLTTENLSELPALAPVDTGDTAEAGWSRLALVLMGKTYVVAVIDRAGRYRWHLTDASGFGTTEISLPGDGSGLIYNILDPDREDDSGEIVSVPWAAVPESRLEAPGMHHAFTALPDGSAAFLAVDIRDWANPHSGTVESVVGDALWELAADGSLRQVFSLWDLEAVAVHDAWDNRFYPGRRDWSHGNGVFYSAERDSYLVSFGNLDLIYELDRQTGAPLRRIHPDTWRVEGTPFSFPHAPSWTPDGHLLVFSYEDSYTAGAREYVVDDEAQTLREVWSHTRSDISLSFLGSTARLANGNTLVNYGAVGIIEEVTPSGVVIWTLNSPFGYWFGTPISVDGVYP